MEHGGELYKAMIFKNLFFESNNKDPNQILFHGTTTVSSIIARLCHIARILWRLQNSFEYIIWFDAHCLSLQLSSPPLSFLSYWAHGLPVKLYPLPSSCVHTIQILPSIGLSKSYCVFKIKLKIQFSLKSLPWWTIMKNFTFLFRLWQAADSIQIVTW